MPRRGHVPKRRCVGCYRSFDKGGLVRIALADGVPVVDESGRMPGRGAYLCPDPNCLAIALKKRSIQRSLAVSVGAEDMEALVEVLRARRIGTEAVQEVRADGEN
jgi:predicted RNA-binding protein YlxR (DUF448 family)